MIRIAQAVCVAVLLTSEAGLAIAVSAAPAKAQDMSSEEIAIYARVIDATCIDMIDDRPGCERVLLVANPTQPDRADLIVVSDRREQTPVAPLLIARAVAFSGAAPGNAAAVQAGEDGILRLSSQQTGMGRFPWFQTLEIAHRDGQFIVAGFAYRTFDRDGGGVMTCELNLLTGAYMVETTIVDATSQSSTVVLADSGQIEAPDLDLETLGTNTPFPAPCEAGLAALDGG